MRKKYKTPRFELIFFDCDDIIVTSGLPKTKYYSNDIWDDVRTDSPETKYFGDGIWDDNADTTPGTSTGNNVWDD